MHRVYLGGMDHHFIGEKIEPKAWKNVIVLQIGMVTLIGPTRPACASHGARCLIGDSLEYLVARGPAVAGKQDYHQITRFSSADNSAFSKSVFSSPRHSLMSTNRDRGVTRKEASWILSPQLE